MFNFLIALIRGLISILILISKNRTDPPASKQLYLETEHLVEEEEEAKPTLAEKLYKTDDVEEIIDTLIEHEDDEEAKRLMKLLKK